MSACERCGGSGFEIVDKDGREFARPCACRRTERRRRGDFAGDCRIPARFADCTFATFDATHPPLAEAANACKSYCDGYPYIDAEEEGLGLLLAGNSGVGKTHLAVAVAQRLYDEKGVRSQFWDFRELMREIRRSYDAETRTTEFAVLDPVVSCDLLILDDLGSARFTEWMMDTLFYVLNTRYLDKLPTLVTTNYMDIEPELIAKDREHAATGNGRAADLAGMPYLRFKEYLVERIGVPLRSRLMQMCHLVKVVAPDHRSARQHHTGIVVRRRTP